MNIASIGLEIHVALKTDRKSFAPESSNESSWVSLGFIGTLPTLNLEALDKAIQISSALNCQVNYDFVAFDRKNYFYYDLPRGYQITQFFHPIGTHGSIELSNGKRIKIKQVHLEEDSAQQFKEGDTIKFNFHRLGRAIAEIVTEPDFSNYWEVEEFLKLFRRICCFNNLSNAAYEEGEMRVDLNISVRKYEEDSLNKKSEVKNLNSLNAISKSIEYLVDLQSSKLDKGEDVESFTYTWSEKAQKCEIMRKKGSSSDYFYVPESNIPPFSVPKERFESLTSSLITNFRAIAEEWKEKGLKDSEIEFLMENYRVYEWVSKLDQKINNLPSAYNWIVNIVSGIHEQGDWSNFPYQEVEKTVWETEHTKKISLKIAKSILKEILVNELTFKKANALLNVSLISDPAAIQKLVDEAFEQYKDQLPKLKENMMKLEKLIIGECMKKSRGQADPIVVKAIFDKVVASWG